jgi:hypothetical protein
MKFEPSKELQNFANTFAEMCMKGDFETKRYHSENELFTIEIIDHEISKTFCRVGHTSGDIQFSDKLLKSGKDELTKESIYFLILWCVCKFNDREKSDLQCDNMVIDHFCRNELPLKPVLSGMKFGLSAAQTKANTLRLKNIKDTLK